MQGRLWLEAGQVESIESAPGAEKWRPDGLVAAFLQASQHANIGCHAAEWLTEAIDHLWKRVTATLS